MKEEIYIFHPPLRLGQIFQLTAAGLLALISLWAVREMTRSPLGPALVRNLLIALVAFIPLLVLSYRLRALQTASYTLQRDGIQLRWGLRAVDIPMTLVRWVHPREDLLVPLPLPWPYWPGSVLGYGLRPLRGAGRVEFLAAGIRNLVLIGTPEQVYAISPADPQAFLATYHRLAEFGSLSPLPPKSVYPTSMLSTLWINRPVRYLLISGLLLSLVLLVWVGLSVPARSQVSLGFRADKSPLQPVPIAALFLLPLLNSLFFLLDVLFGLFFYRHEHHRPLAYALWVSAAVIPLFFLIAAYFILQNG